MDRALQQMASQLDAEVKRGEEMDAQKSYLHLQVIQMGEQLDQLAKGGKVPDEVTTQNLRVGFLF